MYIVPKSGKSVSKFGYFSAEFGLIGQKINYGINSSHTTTVYIYRER